jgi:siroheme synthase (precorrin-2 oxidase/ferrochelatase)
MNIEDLVKKQIKEMDLESMVVEVIKGLISYETKQILVQIIKNKIDVIIEKEIQAVLNSPLETDNGFGDRKYYGSFDEFFKKTFAERLNKSWEMKQTIERSIRDRVDEHVKQNMDSLCKKMAAELTSIIKQK